jgi:hypothetical protein
MSGMLADPRESPRRTVFYEIGEIGRELSNEALAGWIVRMSAVMDIFLPL